MSTTVLNLTTNLSRNIRVTKDSLGWPYLRVGSSRDEGDYYQAALTPAEARRIVDALGPLAAPPRTAGDVFNDMELGTHFRAGADRTERVKVSVRKYVVLGGAVAFDIGTLAGLPASAIEVIR